jgi:hypothetical protein
MPPRRRRAARPHLGRFFPGQHRTSTAPHRFRLPEGRPLLDIPNHQIALEKYLETYGLFTEIAQRRIVARQNGEVVLTATFDESNQPGKLDVAQKPETVSADELWDQLLVRRMLGWRPLQPRRSYCTFPRSQANPTCSTQLPRESRTTSVGRTVRPSARLYFMPWTRPVIPATLMIAHDAFEVLSSRTCLTQAAVEGEFRKNG